MRGDLRRHVWKITVYRKSPSGHGEGTQTGDFAWPLTGGGGRGGIEDRLVCTVLAPDPPWLWRLAELTLRNLVKARTKSRILCSAIDNRCLSLSYERCNATASSLLEAL